MSARNDHAGLIGLVVSAAQDLPDPFLFHGFRHAQDIQGQPRFSAHGVDIRNRIGRGNLTEQVRIVHDRRKEIHRLDQRRFIIDDIDAGVVALVESDNQARIRPRFEILQQFGERSRAYLGAASCAGCQLCQPCFCFHRFILPVRLS